MYSVHLSSADKKYRGKECKWSAADVCCVFRFHPCQGSSSVKACALKIESYEKVSSSGFHDINTESRGDVGWHEDVSRTWAKEQGDGC